MLWIFMAGGILDRYAPRTVRPRAFGFFAGAGEFLLPFPPTRPGAVAGLRRVVRARLHPWLFDTLYPRFTHEMSVERTAFAVRVGLYLVFGAALAASTMIFDYAKGGGPVVEDRRSMIGAIGAAAGFHPTQRRRGAHVVFS